MISFDDAIGLLAKAVSPLGTETVTLADAADRFLAAPLVARANAPRRAVSSMDGYAVAADTTYPDRWIDVVGEARAGAPASRRLGPGEAARIFTGAALPDGADLVIMQEYADRQGERVRFRPGYGPDTHVRAAGSDFRVGDILVPAGTRLGPRAMVTAAAADRAHLDVYRRPTVAIIATGDELAEPGTSSHTPDTLPESASYGVAALCARMGGVVVARMRGRDCLDELASLAARALEMADCVVVIGGASVGDRDFARPMFAKTAMELVFAGVAIKPGKPVWLGKAKGRTILGLPGNPTSAMVTARLFLQPALTRLQGGDPATDLAFQAMPLAQALPATGPRETFVRASAGPHGLQPVGNQESGAQAPLLAADWLIRCPPGQPAMQTGHHAAALTF